LVDEVEGGVGGEATRRRWSESEALGGLRAGPIFSKAEEGICEISEVHVNGYVTKGL